MNSSGGMSFRETRVITVNEISQEYIFPERLRLKLASAKGYKSPIDIGSIAYAKRGKVRSRGFDNAGTISVVESSLVESRRELVVNLLDSLIGLRDNSIVTQFRIIHITVEWLNANGYVEIFADVSRASKAYADYTDYLNDSVRKRIFAPQHAAKCQSILKVIISLQFPSLVDYVVRSAILQQPLGGRFINPRLELRRRLFRQHRPYHFPGLDRALGRRDQDKVGKQ